MTTLAKSHKYIISDKILGKGSYGNVYLGTYDNKEIAIKCCDMYDNGIENIMETSIMKSLLHPNINHAIEIFCTPDNLYIIQDLALMDLYTYTNINKNNHKCNNEELIHIFYSITQAVAIMHHQKLIHCDIKSNNILLFPNNIIKLTDFTLSVRKNNLFYTNTVCTPTHRPIECHLKQPWNESLDIWSLGCTFYEIAYNQPLFVNQSFIDKSYDKKKAKEIINRRYINAIINWAELNNQEHNYFSDDISYDANNITTINTNDIYDLIKSMLHINSSLRPIIFDIMNNILFKNKKPINLQIIEPEQNILSPMEEARILRYIEQCCISNDDAQLLAYKLYTQLTLDIISEYNKAIGCAWIASKLFNILIGNVNTFVKLISLDEILYIEREILQNLECYF